MKKRFLKILLPILAVLAGIIFLQSGYSLLDLRFSRGDVHDRYSSFRADPLGCKALYESLQKLPGLRAERLLRPVGEIGNPEKAVLLITGVSSYRMIIEDRQLLDFALNGGRIVILFSPDAKAGIPEKRVACKDGMKEKKHEKKLPGVKFNKSYFDRWGFSVVKGKKAKDNMAYPSEKAESDYSFEPIPFYSELCFKISEDWTAYYFCEGRPVVIEKKLGTGSLFMAVDSTFVSNEALLKAPALKLLCHTLSDRKNIYFDETAHGIEEERNVFWLGRKYKLEILLANLALTAFLFVWKTASTVSGANPSSKPEAEPEEAPEKHAASGLSNLFKRGIPGKNILSLCLAEWKKTAARRNIPNAEMEKIDAISKEKSKSVEAYNKIHEIIYGLKARKK